MECTGERLLSQVTELIFRKNRIEKSRLWKL